MKLIFTFFVKLFNNPVFLKNRLFMAVGILIAMFLLGFVYIGLFIIAKIAFILLMATVALEMYLLFSQKNALIGKRDCADRLSNGDENNVYLYCENRFGFKIQLSIVDEIPHQFQLRDFNFTLSLSPGENKSILYKLRPVRRGSTTLGLCIFT